jgi:uncharacterized protein (TIGR02118 family)
MSIKVVVLYPPPIDEAAFEARYHGQHMPLMRGLIGPAERTPTFRIRGDGAARFYRMAEIHFASLAEVSAFGSSEGGQRARRSSEGVSSGGKPLLLICERDAS